MRESRTAKREQHNTLLRYHLQRAVKGVLALSLTLAMLLAIGGGNLWRLNLRSNDIEGTSAQIGTAVVTAMKPVLNKQGMSMNVEFRVNERVSNLNIANDERLIWTHVGDTVPVTYRVGKSGAIYIENWQAPPHKVPLSR